MRNAEAIFADEDRRVFDAYRYAPAVKVGRQVHVSGTLGIDRDGNVPADLRDELHLAFTSIDRLLTAAGGMFDHVVSIDSFHVTDDMPAALRTFNEIRATYMTQPDPAWTAVGVTGLAVPSARVEIKVTACLDPAEG